MDLFYSQNLAKIKAEVPAAKQHAVIDALNACWELKHYFTIAEIRRSYARQLFLYAQGRTRPGPIVTRTLNSKHLKGLAMDIYPIEPTTHKEIAGVMSRFGITHPIRWDPPHYELDEIPDRVYIPEPLNRPTPEARVKGLENRKRTARPELLASIQRLIDRINKRLKP